MRTWWLLWQLCLLPFTNLYAQQTNMLTRKPVAGYDISHSLPVYSMEKAPYRASWKTFVLPVTFITYGILARTVNGVGELDHSIHRRLDKRSDRRVPVDDYMQYIPAVGVYVTDWCGLKAKHSWQDRTILMATSHLLMAGTVQTMKRTIRADCPDGGKRSFPSGHTATVFTGAHLLFREYKDTSFWPGIAGYTVATTTGLLRMVNRRYWFSDVVAGAGIGILSVEASYLLLPLFQKKDNLREQTDARFTFFPLAIPQQTGVGMVCTF
ncbi:MAG: phosphatase PAP2 family protein [Tannerellaceae bacterium]|nr:phosphatase PAP2 family protein [Tannerellaceae bacterium]